MKAKALKARAKTVEMQHRNDILVGQYEVSVGLHWICQHVEPGTCIKSELAVQQPGTLRRVRALVKAAKAVRDEDCCDPIGDDKRLLEALDALEGRL